MGLDNTVGTPLGMTAAGFSFNVHADADVQKTLSGWKNEGLATSGGTMIKKTKQPIQFTAVDVSGGAATLGKLALIAESMTPIPLTITDTGGTTWAGLGWVDLAEHSDASGKTPVTFIFEYAPTPAG